VGGLELFFDGAVDEEGECGVSDNFTFDYSDTYAKGAPVRGDDNKPRGREKGTGKGADVVLFFSAGTWTSPWDWPGKPDGPGFLPDDVLFHELVHTTRMLRGKQTHVEVTGRPNFGNIEEYFATVISNIYLSEKGRDDRLRGTYSQRPDERDEGSRQVL
jgi:hypothetical protein